MGRSVSLVCPGRAREPWFPATGMELWQWFSKERGDRPRRSSQRPGGQLPGLFFCSILTNQRRPDGIQRCLSKGRAHHAARPFSSHRAEDAKPPTLPLKSSRFAGGRELGVTAKWVTANSESNGVTPEGNAMLSLGEAARHAGVSKTTIHRSIKSGRLSAQRNDDGTYSIDPAEVFRVFPASKRSETAIAEQTVTPSEPGISALEVALLRERIEELKADRDSWRAQAERLALNPPAATGSVSGRRSWLPWRR
jgi:hypothetical protein